MKAKFKEKQVLATEGKISNTGSLKRPILKLQVKAIKKNMENL
jgi:hypothetical protein